MTDTANAAPTESLAWRDVVKLVDQLRDIALERGQGFQSDADVDDARTALLVHIRAIATDRWRQSR